MTSPLSSLGLIARVASDRLKKSVSGSAFSPFPGFGPPDGSRHVPGRKAHFEPDQIDRVLTCGFGTTVEQQVARLVRTELPEQPIQIRSLGPATVIAGQIFTKTDRHFMFSERLSLRAIRDIETCDTPVTLLNSEQGIRYFGHWLRDDCAAYEALTSRGERLLSMPRPVWPDARVYEDLFGQRWDECKAFHTPELTVVRDMGFSRDKRDRLRALRARLRDRRQGHTPGSVVYVSRGASGEARHVTNEAALVSVLEKQGVTIVHPEAGDTSIIDAILDASVIVTVEGSQAAHAVYGLADRGGLLILQPPARFYNAHLDWTQLLDMEYGIVIGTAREQGFHIEPDEVLRMIERLKDACARP